MRIDGKLIRRTLRTTVPTLPEMDPFDALVAEIDSGAVGIQNRARIWFALWFAAGSEKPRPPTSHGGIVISSGRRSL
jgi:hypothetical protein